MYNNFKPQGYSQPNQFNPQMNRFNQGGSYPQEIPNGYIPPMQQSFFKGRPVVSYEEARAAQIDFDGSLYIFTDLGKGKIYTKQINPDGTATLNTFVLTKESEGSTEYVTKQEFETALANITASLREGVKESSLGAPQKKLNF